MAFLAVITVVFLFSLFAPEPRFGVEVSLPVSHAIILDLNWAIGLRFSSKGLTISLLVVSIVYLRLAYTSNLT